MFFYDCPDFGVIMKIISIMVYLGVVPKNQDPFH